MNKYTFYTAEANLRPVAQHAHGDRKDMALCERASVLDQHECQQRVHGQAMCHMLGLPANAAPRKGITL